MEDSQIWAFEEGLWIGDAEHYRTLIDEECVMVLPREPFVFTGSQAMEAVVHTPRWSKVLFSATKIARPCEGLITIAYQVEASQNGAANYIALCTTTMRRLEHDVWRVVQHQQNSPLHSNAST